MVPLAELQNTLPNFPAEVLEDWLLPYAHLEGWPPAPSDHEKPLGRWRYLLKNRPLTYWQSLSWNKVKRHISAQDLHPDWQEIMVQMVLGAVQDQNNLYSSSILNLAPRFNRIKEYFSDHGIFPKPPVLLIEQQKLTILDGNHRMATYLYCYGYFNLDPGATLQLKTEELQTYWVAHA